MTSVSGNELSGPIPVGDAAGERHAVRHSVGPRLRASCGLHRRGRVTFTVTDDDGAVSSAADVPIEVASVNDPPEVLAQSVEVVGGESVDIVLGGTDIDGTVAALRDRDAARARGADGDRPRPDLTLRTRDTRARTHSRSRSPMIRARCRHRPRCPSG